MTETEPLTPATLLWWQPHSGGTLSLPPGPPIDMTPWLEIGWEPVTPSQIN